MATTSKPKRSKAEALIIIAIFIASAFVAGFAVVRDAAGAPPVIVIESQPPEPVISGDTVFVNDTKVFLSATPHTLNMSTWVEIHLISKLFTGQIDVAFGFNTSSAVPLKAEQWTGFEWIPWTPEFERVDLDFMGMDRWIVLRNRTVDAGTEYAIRIWMELQFNGPNAGKYFFGVKPTSLTVAEAISANKLYFVDPWWSTDYDFRQKLTFDNSGQSEDLVNFPVLINLTASNFNFTITQADGDDIRFIDADNTTALDYETELWDAGTESGVVWVEVPQIDGGSTTDHIWMYYGNATVITGENIPGTWNADYVMVHHFGQATNSTLLDSTINSNDGSQLPLAGPPVRVVGDIGYGWDFDGTNDRVTVTNAASLELTTGTIEVSINYDEIGSNQDFMNKFLGGNKQYQFVLRNTNFLRFTLSPDGAGNIGPWSANASLGLGLSHVAVNWLENTGTEFWIDGSASGWNNITVTPFAGQSTTFVGALEGVANFVNGTFNEVRVSNVSRSDDWLIASYLSISDQLITFSGEQVKFWAVTFAQTGLPITISDSVVTVNGTTYRRDELPATFTGEFPSVVEYSYISPLVFSSNLDYVLTLVSGGIPAQTAASNIFAPDENRTITATYSTVGNPVFPIIFIGVFVAILLAILGVYVKTRKKG